MSDRPPNPDPLRPPDTDIDFMPSAEYVQGFDDGYSDAEALRSPFLTQVTAFGLGIVIGMALAAALIASAAASRPGPDPTAPSPASVAGFALALTPAASASGPGQSGTPRPVAAIPAVWDRAPSLRLRGSSGNLPRAGALR